MRIYSKAILQSIRASLFIMLIVVLIGLVRLADSYLKWGIFGIDGFQPSSVFVFFIALLIIYKPVRNSFFQHFVKVRKKHLVMVIGKAIFLGIGLQIVFNFVRYFVYWLNDSSINVGSSQYVPAGNLSTEGEWVIVCLLGPFNEEVMFRFITYVYFFLLLNKCKDKFVTFKRIYDGSEEKKKHFRVGWLIVSSIIFTLYHGVDITNFWLYLIPGAIYGALFMGYGFLAAWIGHTAFNVTSSSVNKVMAYLFGM